MSHRHLASALACCLLPALPGVARAAIDKVDSIHISASPFVAAPVIHVANDGEAFTHVSAPVSVGANVDVDCKGTNKVQSAHLVWGTPSIGDGWWEAGTAAYSGPSIPGTGGGSLGTAASMSVPAEHAHLGGAGIPGDPIAACNWALEARVADGEPRWLLLRDGFSTSGTHVLSFAARCQFDISNNQYVYWEYDAMFVDTLVACEGNPDVEPPPEIGAADAVAMPFQVTSATIGPDASPIEQVCPAEVTLHGRIQTNGAGEVTFRLIEGGAAGPLTQLHFTEHETVFEFELEVSVGALPPGGDPGSFVESAASGSGGGIDDYQGVANGVHHRTVAIETLAPHAKLWTGTHYTVICGDPQVNPDLGPLPDGLVPLLPEPFSGKLPAPGALAMPGASVDGVLAAGMLGDDPASRKIQKKQRQLKKKILERAAKRARKAAKVRH